MGEFSYKMRDGENLEETFNAVSNGCRMMSADFTVITPERERLTVGSTSTRDDFYQAYKRRQKSTP